MLSKLLIILLILLVFGWVGLIFGFARLLKQRKEHVIGDLIIENGENHASFYMNLYSDWVFKHAIENQVVGLKIRIVNSQQKQ